MHAERSARSRTRLSSRQQTCEQTCYFAENATGGKSAYIRYVVPTPDDEEATVEYNLDEEDEEWLQHHCQVSHACMLSQSVHCLRQDMSEPYSCSP